MSTDLNIYIQECSKRDFGILKKWTNYNLKTNQDFEEAMIRLLAPKFDILLNEDFDGLMRILYEHDISEKKVKMLFDGSFHNEIALKLSKMYLERLIEKYHTRLQYQSNVSEDDYWM